MIEQNKKVEEEKVKEDEVKNALLLAQRKIEYFILFTPSGEERNELTEINIKCLAALNLVECKEKEDSYTRGYEDGYSKGVRDTGSPYS